MAKQTLNGPQYDSQEFNTGNSTERGDSPKEIVRKINENFAELYADDAAEATEAPVRYIDVTVSSAELLAMFATPKTLVAAPAAGLMNVFEGILITKPAGTAYAGIASGEDLQVSLGTVATALAQIETTGFLDQATVQTRYAPAYKAASGLNGITPANSAILLSLLVGEITTGNSALLCRVFYRQIPTVLA